MRTDFQRNPSTGKLDEIEERGRGISGPETKKK